MKTNFKFISIISLILFIVPSGLSFTFAQNNGYYENDYGNYRSGTGVEINNYYGGYGNQISYAARINRFHRTYVSIDYFTPYYYVEYYNYYTPFWDEWSYYSLVDYYFGVSVFYSPRRYYHRPWYYTAYWSQPVYYNTYYYNYNSCRNIPVYYQSAYYGYPSKRYGMHHGNHYSAYNSYKHENYGTVQRNAYSSSSKRLMKTQASKSVTGQNRSRTQSGSVGVSSKRRSQNHYVSNRTSTEKQNNHRTTVKNASAKTKYSSGRRSSGSRYALTNRKSLHNLPATKMYSNRRSASGTTVKAKKVTTGRSYVASKTGNLNSVARKTVAYSGRRSVSPGRSQVAVRSNTRAKRTTSAGKTEQKRSGRTEVVSERRHKK